MRELEYLLVAAAPGRVVNIHTVDGMPGIGKTALVTHAAHRLADRFPDGQFFHDLHAHTPGQTPAEPIDVLAMLLTDLGIDPRNLPATLEGRSALWRDRLTGKKVLLVLDDAAGHAQITPLLPSSPGSLTLVTSRTRLIALDGAHPLSLDSLEPGDAAALFTRLAHRVPTGSEREAVDETVRLCGYLPLAIALLAGRLRSKHKWSIAEFATEFAATRDRLGELAGGDRAVYTAFTLSYHDLTPGQQRLFRRIGLHPGPDIDIYAAAALGNTPLSETRHHLEALYTHHLLDEAAPGRYQPHDLLRAYARALSTDTDPADDRARSLSQLLDYYQHTAQAADRHLSRTTRHAPPATRAPVAIPPLPGRASALEWMRTERTNLLACLDTLAPDQATRRIHLTAAMASFLRHEGPWPQAATLHQHAATTARHHRDRHSLANALRDLGIVRRLTDDYEKAADLLRQAGALYRDLGDRLGLADTLRDLGTVRRLTGDYAAAADLLQQARGLYQGQEGRLGLGYTLRDLGIVRYLTGDYAAAADLLQQARSLFQDLGDQLGLADTLNDLGIVRYLTDDYGAAADLLQQARGLYQDLGSRLGLADALRDLGVVRYLTGDYGAAADLLQQARGLFEDLGDRLGLAEVMNSLGTFSAVSGEPRAGRMRHRQALRLAREIHSPLEEARALEGSARCLVHTGDRAAAMDELHQAIGIYRRIGAAEAESAAAYLALLKAEHAE
ncbi:ATP-binding protein [Streptomyces sclerotialus]|uniref:ATP-binding protein n=1 Tax=Streptomyces sclerotialus TaxID=1957 RepID=UPI0018CBDF44